MSLVAVLREIGAKVGFTVVESAPSSVTVTFSDREAALDDVLRQLLRAENHTVFYRAGTGRTSQVREAIDRIVLSGEPSTSLAVAGTSGAQDRLQSDRPRGAGDDAPSVAMRPPTSPSPVPLPEPDTLSRWPDLALGPPNPDDPPAPPVTVGDLLKANAIAALLAVPQAVPANPQAVPANPQAVPAPPPRRRVAIPLWPMRRVGLSKPWVLW